MYLEKDGRKIIEDLECVDGIFKKIKGLMFRELDEGEGLLMEFPYEARWSIWMLFVPQDLSLFFLDNEGKVVDKKLAEKMGLNPATWKIYKPEKKCKYVLECNPERFKDLKTGEKLRW